MRSLNASVCLSLCALQGRTVWSILTKFAGRCIGPMKRSPLFFRCQRQGACQGLTFVICISKCRVTYLWNVLGLLKDIFLGWRSQYLSWRCLPCVNCCQVNFYITCDIIGEHMQNPVEWDPSGCNDDPPAVAHQALTILTCNFIRRESYHLKVVQ